MTAHVGVGATFREAIMAAMAARSKSSTALTYLRTVLGRLMPSELEKLAAAADILAQACRTDPGGHFPGCLALDSGSAEDCACRSVDPAGPAPDPDEEKLDELVAHVLKGEEVAHPDFLRQKLVGSIIAAGLLKRQVRGPGAERRCPDCACPQARCLGEYAATGRKCCPDCRHPGD